MLGLGSSITSSTISSLPPFVNTTTNTNAMTFDGSGDFLQLADNDDFSFVDTPFSVAAWVKRSSVSNGGLFHKGTFGNNLSTNEYRVFFVTNRLFIDIGDGGYNTNARYRRIIFPNDTTNWQHIVITSNGTSGASLGGGNIKVYVNGSEVSSSGTGGSDADGLANKSGKFEIGRTNESGFQHDGQILQFIMWRNKELTQSDVTYLYADGAAHRDPTQDAESYTSSSSVVLWLPLQSNSNDSSGNGHNFTVNGDAFHEDDVPF
tara:strand:- start:1494 stop:2279 length:786 start_codon:yes stop_codon:yes gene_type:complete